MYVCIYIYKYIIHARMYAFAPMHVYVCVCMYACIWWSAKCGFTEERDMMKHYTTTHFHMCVYMHYIYTHFIYYIYIYMHTYTGRHSYAHTFIIYIHVFTYIHIQHISSKWGLPTKMTRQPLPRMAYSMEHVQCTVIYRFRRTDAFLS